MFTAADVIYTYTREQALQDGVLIDISSTAREAGYLYPVAVTSRVWSEVITPDERTRSCGQSEAGRMWDMLTMLKHYIRRKNTGQTVIFKFYAIMPDKYGQVNCEDPRLVTLKSECHPGDNWEPVITIMLPNED